MKRRYLTWLLALGICIFGGPAAAQISEGGTPPSFDKLSLAAPRAVVTPPIDVQALLEEDAREQEMGLPFRFGRPFDVNYDLDNSGTWDDLDDGGRIWRLAIRCPSAYSINLVYDTYWLPTGARLFVYNDTRDMVIGAFTERNNKDHGRFATAPIKGDVTIIEYYEPAEVRGLGRISISRIVHGYRNVFFRAVKDAMGFGDSGPCNNNVNCPEGLPWQNEKRSVAMILTSGGYRICSGALVNNVREDATPYFLTANHCLGGEPTWIFMFNYESPSCDDIDGPTIYTVQGSTLRATYEPSDFALLEITEQPPDSYNVYFAGWSNLDTPSQSSTAIHHPSGDIKKISFDYDPVTSTDYLTTTGTTHWRIGNWEDGTTEPGSSGSPLFDQNHRVVGQLHGGYASCYSILADWYGKFATSWDGGGSPSTRLKDWLDPDNTGTTLLEGFDPDAGTSIVHQPLPDTKDTLNNYEVTCLITSNAELVPGELLLHYQLAAIWYDDQLQPTGNQNEYHGFIPAQSAGTTISYFLTAADIEGTVDTTDTFSFLVDYSAAIAVAPSLLSPTVLIGDSAVEELVIENNGNGVLDYTIGVYQFLKSSVFKTLLDAGELAPSRRLYSQEFYTYVAAKGADTPLDGFPVEKDAGGPDGFGYVWIDSDESGGPAFDWIDISAVGTDITSGIEDDNYVGPFPIGFDFPFYGNTYTEFYVGSNGIIGFDAIEMDTRFPTPLPAETTPNNILAWLWYDLNILDGDNPGGRIYYHSDGARLVIQFVDYPEFMADPGDVVTAEVIFDSSGYITCQYLDIAPGFDVENCAVGMENADGTDGLEVAYLAPYLHNGLAVQFFMPYQWLTISSSAGSIPPGDADTVWCTFTTAGLDTGLYTAQIIITSNDPDPEENPWIVDAQLTVVEIPYICGDANRDDTVNVADAVYLIGYIFKGGPAPDPLCIADANGDDIIHVADVVYLISYIFRGGPPPVDPCCP